MHTPSVKSCSGRELTLVAAGLLALLLAEFALADAFSLFPRYFWYDEWLAHTIVTDPDLPHSLTALAKGVEGHPPTFYLSLRAYLNVLGRSDETALRSFAFLMTLVALVGVYATLRLRFAVLPSVAGVLALLAHSLVLFHAVEARPYNLFLAGTAWLAYFLVRSRIQGFNARVAIGLIVTTILVCTTHYFGILAVGLLVVGDAVLSYRSATGLRAPALVLGVGLLSVLCCFPMLRSQRAAYTAPTWLVLNKKGITDTFEELFAPSVYFVVLAWVVGVSLLWRFRWFRKSTARIPRGAIRLYSGVIALALLPFVLLVMSYIYQPVLLGRYALMAVIPLSVVVAWLCSGQNSWVVALLCLAFCGTTVWELHQLADTDRNRDVASRELFNQMRKECDENAPLVSDIPMQLAFVVQYAPDLASRCYQIDFDRKDLDIVASDELIVNRDLGRSYAHYYDRPPRLLNCADFHKHRVVYLVTDRTNFLPHLVPLRKCVPHRLDQIHAFELKFPESARSSEEP